MPPLAADENFNGLIVHGLLRRLPELDLVRVQDTPFAGATDTEVLAWAASQGRVVLTHDTNTLKGIAVDRVVAGLPMPGVIAVHSSGPIGLAIEEILLLVQAGRVEDFDRCVVFVPLGGSAYPRR